MQVATLPPRATPVALVEIPEPSNLPMVEAPHIQLPPVPVASAAGKPKRERKKPPPKTTPAPEPVQVAAAEPRRRRPRSVR